MADFPAEFSSKAAKHIKKLDIITKKRIDERVSNLEENPFPQEVERVEDFEGEKVFRVRVGYQRILYIITVKAIVVAKIFKSRIHFVIYCYKAQS